jgi:hypothetical protein
LRHAAHKTGQARLADQTSRASNTTNPQTDDDQPVVGRRQIASLHAIIRLGFSTVLR